MAKRTLIYGLPTFALVLLGTYGLSHFIQTKIDAASRHSNRVNKENVPQRKEFDLEEAYQDMKKKVDLSKLEYVSIERKQE